MLQGATTLIASNNKHNGCPPDWTACVDLSSNFSGTFAGLPVNPTFANDDDADAWLASNDSTDYSGTNIFVFNTIFTPIDGFVGGIATKYKFSSMMAVWSDNTSDVKVPREAWAHEIGHNCGLDHYDSGDCTYNIMRKAIGELGRDRLDQSEAEAIETWVGIYGTSGTVKCDPTGDARLSDMLAFPADGGVQIDFETFHETHTQSFEVQRIDPEPDTLLYSVGTPTWQYDGALKKYSIIDSNGADGSCYRVVEHQTDGRGPISYGPIIAATLPAPGAGQSDYDADSLAAIANAQYIDEVDSPPLYHGCTGGQPPYLILCPDSFATACNNYASLWWSHGVQTQVRTFSLVDSCFGGYQAYIHWAAGQGTKYFLLVGDANDHVMWDDSTRWVNGWAFPYLWSSAGPGLWRPLVHIPSQPQNDIIPTFYYAEPDSPQVNWTSFTPYFASDLPYSDVDGDGLPDVIVGRLPASNVSEVNAYVAKLANWFTYVNGNFTSRAALVTYGSDGPAPAWLTELAADSLRAGMSPTVNFTDIDYSITRTKALLDSVNAVVNSAASGGADLIAWNTNWSDAYTYGRSWSLFYPTDNLPLNTNLRPFVSLALSCGMNNFDETEKQIVANFPNGPLVFTGVQPIVERLLFDAGKGAIAQVGPTRGSYVRGNTLLGTALLQRLYEPGNSLGRAFLLAQREMLLTHPEYRDMFRSYVLLGDPRIGPYTVTGVSEQQQFAKEVLFARPAPNPFNPTTRLRYYLPQQGEVSLVIFDIRGRVVRSLATGKATYAGWTQVAWDGKTQTGTDAASGVYFARLKVGKVLRSQRLVLLR